MAYLSAEELKKRRAPLEHWVPALAEKGLKAILTVSVHSLASSSVVWLGRVVWLVGFNDKRLVNSVQALYPSGALGENQLHWVLKGPGDLVAYLDKYKRKKVWTDSWLANRLTRHELTQKVEVWCREQVREFRKDHVKVFFGSHIFFGLAIAYRDEAFRNAGGIGYGKVSLSAGYLRLDGQKDMRLWVIDRAPDEGQRVGRRKLLTWPKLEVECEKLWGVLQKTSEMVGNRVWGEELPAEWLLKKATGPGELKGPVMGPGIGMHVDIELA